MKVERKMFYGAPSALFVKAKQLRENMTPAELHLWQILKENKLGVRFKPQHPLKYFIADFYCHQLKLVIEVDGEIHQFQKDYDKQRSEIINNFDIIILRFRNEEVLNNLLNVVSTIKSHIKSSLAHPKY